MTGKISPHRVQVIYESKRPPEECYSDLNHEHLIWTDHFPGQTMLRDGLLENHISTWTYFTMQIRYSELFKWPQSGCRFWCRFLSQGSLISSFISLLLLPGIEVIWTNGKGFSDKSYLMLSQVKDLMHAYSSQHFPPVGSWTCFFTFSFYSCNAVNKMFWKHFVLGTCKYTSPYYRRTTIAYSRGRGCSSGKGIPLLGWRCETPIIPLWHPLWHWHWPKWYPRCPSIHILLSIGGYCRMRVR